MLLAALSVLIPEGVPGLKGGGSLFLGRCLSIMCVALNSAEPFRFAADSETEGGRTLLFGGIGYPLRLKPIDDVLAPVGSILTQSGSILALNGLGGLFGLET